MKYNLLILPLSLLMLGIGTNLTPAAEKPASNPATATGTVQSITLNEIGFKGATVAWNDIRPGKLRNNKPPTLEGIPQSESFGVLGNGLITYQLKGKAYKFSGKVGIDDSVVGSFTENSEVLIYGDNKKLWTSGPLRAGGKAVPFDVDVSGVQFLELITDFAGNQFAIAHVVVADAAFTYSGVKPAIIYPRIAPKPTNPFMPPKGPETPRITGGRLFGVRPGSPFLFTVTASGRKPMTFGAKDLPKGLTLDAQTGRITGRLDEKAEYRVRLSAENQLGRAERELKIVVGDQLALSPPMGWNSWTAMLHDVDQAKVEKLAELMVSSGLKDHGYVYVNIDDTWQGERTGKDMALQANKKFPDMKALTGKIHSLGLKAGIYHTPWMSSFARYPGGTARSAEPGGPWVREAVKEGDFNVGPVSFLNQDARQFGEWGFDYVKWDWHPHKPEHIIAVNEALKQSGRDMISSLSNRAVFEHAAIYEKHANAWRTTNDFLGRWVFLNSIAFSQERWTDFVGPGHWVDMDMLVVGHCWGKPVTLTPDEQYLQFSMWCLMSSPLLLSTNLEKTDEFALRLLTNDEVIEINQDPLGKAARRTLVEGPFEVWVKELEDGSKAAGFFNRSREPMEKTVDLKALGLSGKHLVRDLWKRADLGNVEGKITVNPPPHGVQLYKFVQTP